LNDNQLQVIKNRIASYPGETWGEVVERVADKISDAETQYSNADYDMKAYWKEEFKWLMTNMYFLPNSPALRNFGANEGNGAACFVLPIEDSRKSIFKTLYHAVEVQAFGGGTGFNFSELRPKGSLIQSTKGQASGPVSFMEVFDKTIGEVICQGGVRKGASMGILNCDHPGIFAFLDAKSVEGKLSNFNLSVGITDEFMQAVRQNSMWTLSHPKLEYPIYIPAIRLWNKIVECAHKNGEPGLIFLDTINDGNLHEEIVATNPCGEIPQPAYTSCVLGSINLRKVPRSLLKRVVQGAVRMLDDIIEVNNYPIPEVQERTKFYRNIGIGVMGYADFLIKRNAVYGSEEAIEDTKWIFNQIKKHADEATRMLSDLKGSCPATPGVRNNNVTSVAPTGTLSLLADCSAGIEPYFAFEFQKNCMDQKITVKSSIVEEAYMNDCLVTANDVAPEDHIRVQATIQKFIDAGISKTINLPNWTSKEYVSTYLYIAWESGCKGITIYRDGSREVEAQSVEKCPECGNKLIREEGCYTCVSRDCGYSKCSM